jgi:hypothetical protein
MIFMMMTILPCDSPHSSSLACSWRAQDRAEKARGALGPAVTIESDTTTGMDTQCKLSK